ncbi:hypothetical protein Apa02nite_084630 [Actinoplanes palleronii]|uniref:Uncharacterized protein n=1 Tax=Actinoplanes palleronii TaxID=113570 RepID=A0ABQ4BQ45_9ACTN|nr:hypothetical protein Apa02nite_084630 [Actinoplanes palleronii]
MDVVTFRDGTGCGGCATCGFAAYQRVDVGGDHDAGVPEQILKCLVVEQPAAVGAQDADGVLAESDGAAPGVALTGPRLLAQR